MADVTSPIVGALVAAARAKPGDTRLRALADSGMLAETGMLAKGERHPASA